MKKLAAVVMGVSLSLASCGAGMCQTDANGGAQATLPDAPVPQTAAKGDLTVLGVPKAILEDQKSIWTSPAHIRRKDLIWLFPLAAATGVGIATDHYTMSSVVTHNPSFNGDSVNVSNTLIGGFIAAPAVLFGYGQLEHDDDARQSGLLGAETLGDAVVVEQGLKLVFWRERPAMDNAHGLFFQSAAGIDSSFPSSHAVVAWSTAALIADRYPSKWVEFSAYSLATGVSLTRVMGREHFPTDVLVGSAAGWLVGHYVARAHRRHHVAVR